jgi:hypothetical protein
MVHLKYNSVFLSFVLFVLFAGCSQDHQDFEDNWYERKLKEPEVLSSRLNDIEDVSKIASYLSGLHDGTSHKHSVIYFDRAKDSVFVFGKKGKKVFHSDSAVEAYSCYEDFSIYHNTLMDVPVQVDGETMYVVSMDDLFPSDSELSKYFTQSERALLGKVSATEGYKNMAKREFPLIYVYGSNDSRRYRFMFEDQDIEMPTDSLSYLLNIFTEAVNN